MKIAGRDAGRMCVVVDAIDTKIVLIDGDVRRRKCNIFHLEPLEKVISLKKGASHTEVEKAFKDLGYAMWNTKPKEKTTKPTTLRSQNKDAAAKQAPKVKVAKVVKAKAEKPKTEKKAPKASDAKKE